MSLGWQTESALLPSKSKPINVDSKSLLSLKAVVFDQETKIGTSRGKNDCKYVRGRIIKSSDPMTRSNNGIEARQQSDLQQSVKDNKSESIIEASLRAKAKLYDEISSKRRLAESTSSNFLVNFQDKKRVIAAKSVEKVADKGSLSQMAVDDVDDMVDIVDTFGRSRRVSKRSSEYAEHYLAESAKKFKSSLVAIQHHQHNDQHDVSHNSSSSSSLSGQWAWSTGHDRDETGDWIEDAIRDRGMKSLIEDRIDHEINASVNVSKGARIKAMWDKTLDSSAREYLDEIHQQVEDERNHHQQQHQQHDVSNASSKASGDVAVVVEAKSELDDRKEFIRRKIEEKRLRQVAQQPNG